MSGIYFFQALLFLDLVMQVYEEELLQLHEELALLIPELVMQFYEG